MKDHAQRDTARGERALPVAVDVAWLRNAPHRRRRLRPGQVERKGHAPLAERSGDRGCARVHRPRIGRHDLRKVDLQRGVREADGRDRDTRGALIGTVERGREAVRSVRREMEHQPELRAAGGERALPVAGDRLGVRRAGAREDGQQNGDHRSSCHRGPRERGVGIYHRERLR